MKHQQEEIIKNYVESYNNFDIKGMIRDLDQHVVFENITNDKVDLQINGIDAFEQQAESAKSHFSVRNQEIEFWHFNESNITIDIHYTAVLAMDLSNDLKAGSTLELKGKSEFVIEGGKIKEIRDYSSR